MFYEEKTIASSRRPKIINELVYLRHMMRKLNREEAIENANRYSLKPVRVKGSDVVQLSLNTSSKFESISWDDFFSALEQKHLAVYISKGGYMKVMSDDIYE